MPPQGKQHPVAAVMLYDTGNFIDDNWNFWSFGSYWHFPFSYDDWSFVFLVDIEAGGHAACE
jgi:hypothetical protein